MGVRMTVQEAEARGLIDRSKAQLKKKKPTAAKQLAEAASVAPKMPRRFIQQTETRNGGMLYQTPDNAWLLVEDGGIVLRLPYPITANAIWRHHDNNNTLSEGARKYRRTVYSMYCSLLSAICWRPYNTMLECRLMIQPPLPAIPKNFSPLTHPRYDVDNYSKPILDALKCHRDVSMLFRDDRLILRQSVRFAAPVQDGCVWVACRPIDDGHWLQRNPDLEWLTGNGHD